MWHASIKESSSKNLVIAGVTFSLLRVSRVFGKAIYYAFSSEDSYFSNILLKVPLFLRTIKSPTLDLSGVFVSNADIKEKITSKDTSSNCLAWQKCPHQQIFNIFSHKP